MVGAVLFSKDGFSLQSIAIDGGQTVTVFTPAQRQRITDAIGLSDHRIIVSMTRPGDPRFSRAGPEVRLWELHTNSAGVAVGPLRRLTEAVRPYPGAERIEGRDETHNRQSRLSVGYLHR